MGCGPSNHMLKSFVTCIISLTQPGLSEMMSPRYLFWWSVVMECAPSSKNSNAICYCLKNHRFKICPFFFMLLGTMGTPMSFLTQMLLEIFFLAYFNDLEQGQVKASNSRQKVVNADIQRVDKGYFCPNVSTL